MKSPILNVYLVPDRGILSCVYSACPTKKTAAQRCFLPPDNIIVNISSEWEIDPINDETFWKWKKKTTVYFSKGRYWSGKFIDFFFFNIFIHIGTSSRIDWSIGLFVCFAFLKAWAKFNLFFLCTKQKCLLSHSGTLELCSRMYG